MLYNYGVKKQKLLQYQNTVLKALSGKIDDFYLTGGTALSLFYFQHRISLDLDFFTPRFSYKRIREIITYLKTSLKKEIKLTAQSLKKDKTRMMVYQIYITPGDILRVDFVEDVLPLVKQPKIVEGVKVLSLEDIYLRKIYAVVGVIPTYDVVGKKKFAGGRIEAKDFYDLYFLSHTFMPISKFVDKYGDLTVKEGLISWFRTYDRMKMTDGVLRLDTDKKIDYRSIEKHFSTEIDKIIESQIEKI